MDRHRQTPWHALKLTEVYETLHTSEEGLGDAEAAERLKKIWAQCIALETAQNHSSNAESADH